MKLVLSILFFAITCSNGFSQSPFRTTWKTDNPGSSGSNSVTIPTATSFGYVYDYDVDWGDGTFSSNVTGNITHTYSSPGTYGISIYRTFPAIYVNDSGDKDKLMTIEAWGDIEWESMSRAFYGCSNLTYNATDSPDLTNTTSLFRMFSEATSFDGNLNNWDVSGIQNMDQLFYRATSFNGNISNWNVGQVTNMRYMFSGASSFNGNISNWNTSNVTNMSYMFSRASVFNQDISNWDVGNVLTMALMFNEAHVFSGNLNSWDVSKVTDMSSMFSNAISFNGTIANWNTSEVTNMASMFYRASSFTQDISNWDVSNVTNMSYMFKDCILFNANLANWNVQKVTTMAYMFDGAIIFNQDIGNWNTESLINASYLFSQCNSFNQDIGSWDVSNVTDFSFMFSGAANFNQNINSWITNSATTTKGMFNNAKLYNQPLHNWNVGTVTDMSLMFLRANNFNQSLDSWNIINVTDMQQMLESSNMSNFHYDQLLNSWSAKAVKSNVVFGALGVHYCQAEDARNDLILNHGWTITDAGIDCTKSDQTIDFLPLPLYTIAQGGFELTASASSGLPVSYTSSDETVATISGNMVTFINIGTITITASQAGNAYFNAAPDESEPITIKNNQEITFNSLDNAIYGDEHIILSATASSGLAVSYSSSNTDVAIVSGNTLQIIGAGNTNITASQVGNSNYAAAPHVVQTLIVNKLAQVITFNAIPEKKYGDPSFQPASISSDLAISYTSSNPDVAIINNNSIEITGVGTTQITASQAGDNNHSAAKAVTQTLTVSKATQSIVFDPLPSVVYGQEPLSLEATSTAGLNISYSLSDESIATIEGSTLTIVGAGSIKIRASQPGNDFYLSANSVEQELIIEKADQAITIDMITDKLTTDEPFAVNASVSSGLEISYEISGPASLEGNIITLDRTPGTVTLVALQPGNVNYKPAENQSIGFSVFNPQITGTTINPAAYRAYPNPATDSFVVVISDGQQAQIQLCDLSGDNLIDESGHEIRMDLSNLPKGLYLLKVFLPEQTIVTKITKQ